MSVAKRHFSRRTFLKSAAVALAAGTVAASSPTAFADQKVLGTVLDYAGGVPSAEAVIAAGHGGAVRYVSQPRADAASWMIGKPVSLTETTDFAEHGLYTASVYQFGKAGSADWLDGAAGVVTHAPQAMTLHIAAGGPTGVPIYVAIDDNPTSEQYTTLIKPYLAAFEVALSTAGYQMGIYGNYNTIDWAIADGLGDYFWQHNWGSNGLIHSSIHLHQVRIDQDTVDGVSVDINNVYQADWGQWQPGKVGNSGQAGTTTTEIIQDIANGQTDVTAALTQFTNSSLPNINVNGSSVNAEQIEQGINLATRIAQAVR